MNEVSSYHIVTAKNTEDMIKVVTEKIAGGWVPSGPVVVFNDSLLQAMVKFN